MRLMRVELLEVRIDCIHHQKLFFNQITIFGKFSIFSPPCKKLSKLKTSTTCHEGWNWEQKTMCTADGNDDIHKKAFANELIIL
jgi:hypothetical protein